MIVRPFGFGESELIKRLVKLIDEFNTFCPDGLGMHLKLSIIVGITILIAGTTTAFAEINFDSKFGTLGNGIDELNSPTDVIISPDGSTIYVADSENHRINVFEDDGDHDFEFGSFCSIFSIQSCNDNANGAGEDGDGQFDTPIVIAVDQYGDYYVVDSENYRIQKFDDGGDFELKFGSSDSGVSEYLAAPRGIAVFDDTNEIFVSGISEDSIVVFDSTGDFVFSFDSFGNDDFNNPEYLRIHEDMLYVADSGNDQIVIFQLVTTSACPSDTQEIVDGVCFVEKFGTSGNDNGEFNSPTGIAFDSQNDLLYVADTNNDRIQILTLSLGQLSLVPSPPANVHVLPLSPTSLMVAWESPDENNDIVKASGYKIEYREGSKNYQVIIADTKSTVPYFIHNGLDQQTSYTYSVSAINTEGTSSHSSSNVAKPKSTDTPVGLVADDISSSQIKLTWHPPSNTFGQKISGYEIKRVLSNGVYDPVGNTDSATTTYVVNGLTTDANYSFAVSANIGYGSTSESNIVTATPRDDSVEDSQSPISSTVTAKTIPAPPKIIATVASSNQVNLSWTVSDDGNSAITGYKIESRKDSGSFITLIEDTKSTSKSYKHSGLEPGSRYSYRVYAINSEGTSDSSNIATITPEIVLQISPLGKLIVNEETKLSFTVKITDSSIDGVTYSLDQSAPAGATINSNSGIFSWTPNSSQGAKTYTFGIIAKTNSMTDTQSVSITVNDVAAEPTYTKEPESVDEEESSKLEIPAPFVDERQDPQSYVDRYLGESSYKEWFDENYPEYSSIYEAVGLNEPPTVPALFVEDRKDPRYYVALYNYDSNYKEWFDYNHPEYSSIYQAVGLPEKALTNYGYCGEGTKLIDGMCMIIKQQSQDPWWKFW